MRSTRPITLLTIALAGLLTTGVLAATNPAQAAANDGGLHAVAVAQNAIALRWNKAGEDAYRIRFSAKPDMSASKTWDVLGNYFEWTRLEPNPGKASARLKAGTTYYFQVKPIKRASAGADRADLGKYSAIRAITTADSGSAELAPTNLKLTEGGTGSVYLSWASRGPGVKYRVRYTTNPELTLGKWSKAIFTTAGGTLTGLKAGARYYLRVQALSRANKALSDYSADLVFTTSSNPGDPGIIAISYNVRKTGGSPSWASRRSKLIAAIKAQNPDIIALQEAVPTKVTGLKSKQVPQYTDIIQRLGSAFAYVSDKSSSGTRLAYRVSRFNVTASGVVALPTLGSSQRYAVWAKLKDKETARSLFVVDTHLEPGSNTSASYNQARVDQADSILALLRSNNSTDLPVLVLGDLNSSRASKPDDGPMGVFNNAGLRDPLDGAEASWLAGSKASAEHLMDMEYNSFNNLEKLARRTAYPVGTRVDNILVSTRIRVASWRTVVDLDANGRFVSVPSDHNMLAVTLHLR